MRRQKFPVAPDIKNLLKGRQPPVMGQPRPRRGPILIQIGMEEEVGHEQMLKEPLNSPIPGQRNTESRIVPEAQHAVAINVQIPQAFLNRFPRFIAHLLGALLKASPDFLNLRQAVLRERRVNAEFVLREIPLIPQGLVRNSGAVGNFPMPLQKSPDAKNSLNRVAGWVHHHPAMLRVKPLPILLGDLNHCHQRTGNPRGPEEKQWPR